MISEYLREQWKNAATQQMIAEEFRPTKQVVTWVARHITLQFRELDDAEMLAEHNLPKVKATVDKIQGEKSRKVGGYFYAVLPTLPKTDFNCIQTPKETTTRNHGLI